MSRADYWELIARTERVRAARAELAVVGRAARRVQGELRQAAEALQACHQALSRRYGFDVSLVYHADDDAGALVAESPGFPRAPAEEARW